MYNLANQQETQVTFDPSPQSRPTISGNKWSGMTEVLLMLQEQ
jgi:hypothetical protein